MLILACGLSFCGSLLLYLTSPNQCWLHFPLHTLAGVGGGSLSLLLAGWLWMQVFSTAAGIFALLMLVMLLLTLFPYLALLKPSQWSGGRHDRRQT